MSEDFLRVKSVGDIKEWLVIIPAAHLFACFVYLFFYYYAFDHGIIRFASPTEVFSVSLSEVAPIYLFGGIGFLLGQLSYESEGEIDERYSEKAARLVKISNSLQVKFIFGSAALAFIACIVASYLVSYIFWNGFIFPVAMGIGAFVFKYSVKRQLPPTVVMVAFGLAGAMTIITFRGLADGQEAARLTVEQFEHQPTCGDFVVLKDVSENFLAVDMQNNRLIIDHQCEVKFRLINAADNEIYDGDGIADYIQRVRSSR